MTIRRRESVGCWLLNLKARVKWSPKSSTILEFSLSRLVYSFWGRRKVVGPTFRYNLVGCNRCVHEYLDVYSEVQQAEPSELINSPFGGRFCGPIPPRRRISLHRTLALAFYTDKNSTSADIFAGVYRFINDCKLKQSFSSFPLYFPQLGCMGC